MKKRKMERKKIKNHLELFPQEIWEMTLEHMEDSKDILSLLRGIPKLDVTINIRKKYWLIDQIIPFLYNFISKRDVLNLRSVCKQWQRRVDFFIPNQPYYRAYSEDLHQDNPQYWGFLDDSKCNTVYYRWPLTLLTADPADDKTRLVKTLEHSRPCNPLMFRELCVLTYSRHDAREAFNLTKLFSFLERFGAHVWYLKFVMEFGVSTAEIDVLLRMLHLVPNLKTFELHIIHPRKYPLQNDIERFARSIPDLPFFETLKICSNDRKDSTKEFLTHLLKSYGPQTRRLFLSENLWKVEFKDLFPQLTELQFDASDGGDYVNSEDIANVAPFKSLLDSICSPRLVKLHLYFSYSKITLNIEDVLKLLKRFPRIKYFEINSKPHQDTDIPEQMLILNEIGTSDPITDSIPSLQILKIVEGHGLSYNFLRCFPSLRELELRPYSIPTVNTFSESTDSFKLREQIQTAKIYESNIWELMPQLRETLLILLIPPPDFRHKWSLWDFTWDIFEKLKKAGMIPTEPQLHSFRQDIQNFMEDFAEAESETDRSRSSDDEDSEEDN